ncbi:hypothetical protein VTN77DRAFT_3745 [Rasamsonia byssochlamydoides]|uniref:uncharacterized protein n=1 Tax=Rasamsonia byssochlamydoides TaxID=89139 RepID=UPI003744A2BA
MSTAQEEFDRLFNHKEKLRGHPEDRDNSDESSSHSDADDQNNHYVHSDDDSDDEDYNHRPANMVSRTAAYTVPSTVFEANTGPKGVIADAQSFERARKRSFRRTLLSVAGLDSYSKTPKAETRSQKENSPNDDIDEEEFMRRWRETRLKELQQQSQRKPSPSKRVYGDVLTVDAAGYLNAVERVASDTVVVVCIYDPESALSAQVEEALTVIARKQVTTRFIKLHHEIAEMNHIDAPALLAYKGGDVFATIVDIPRQLSRGSEIDADSIENLLQQNGVF